MPAGGQENGEVMCGPGDLWEKYVGRILFSVGWHKSSIVRRLYAIRTRLMARWVAGGLFWIATSMRKIECDEAVGGIIEGPSMLKPWTSMKFHRDLIQVLVARWECVLNEDEKKGVDVPISSCVDSIVVMMRFPDVLGRALFSRRAVSCAMPCSSSRLGRLSPIYADGPCLVVTGKERGRRSLGRRNRLRSRWRERRSFRARVVVASGNRRERKRVVWNPLHSSMRRCLVFEEKVIQSRILVAKASCCWVVLPSMVSHTPRAF